MKRVLIIAYYWPPSGGSGVQRWVKFVKHLRSFGWEPIIYTPENPFVTEHDETLLKEIPEGVEVLKLPVFEVTKYFGAPTASNTSGSNKPSLLGQLKKSIGSFVRGNFFIPDPRVTWVAPSVRFLTSYLEKNKVDAIVSTGPPNSMHVIAAEVKKKTALPWLADFRDPWMEVLKFHDFNISALALSRHQKLFNQVLKTSDSIIVAHPSVKPNFQKLTSTPVEVITNGYDTEDMAQSPDVAVDKAKFKLVFIGILYDALNSSPFWQALAELAAENHSFKQQLQLLFVGNVKQAAMNDLEVTGLMKQSVFTGYVNHLTAVSYEKAADVLLLFTPAGDEFKYIIPGKLFEYLAAQKPILCVAPLQNDSAQIVIDTKGGQVVSPSDKAAIKKTLSQLFDAYEKGALNVSSQNVEQYERKKLTEKLVSELNRIAR